MNYVGLCTLHVQANFSSNWTLALKYFPFQMAFFKSLGLKQSNNLVLNKSSLFSLYLKRYGNILLKGKCVLISSANQTQVEIRDGEQSSINFHQLYKSSRHSRNYSRWFFPLFLNRNFEWFTIRTLLPSRKYPTLIGVTQHHAGIFVVYRMHFQFKITLFKLGGREKKFTS